MYLRLRGNKFQLSGFTDSERIQLARYIGDLKGHYLDSKEYIAETSHIICAQPTRSEKYLCGCAAAKWILTKEYILESHTAGQWLNEVDYEWGNLATKHRLKMTRTPKHWREYMEKTGKHPFTDWIVAVAIENNLRRPTVYKRLLQTGGAKVVNLGTAKASDLTHILVEAAYISKVKSFATAGVACVKPAYLAEVLMEETPTIENFLAISLPGLNNNNNTIGSNCDLSLRSTKSTTSTPKISVPSIRSSAAKSTTSTSKISVPSTRSSATKSTTSTSQISIPSTRSSETKSTSTSKMGGSATKSVCSSSVNSRNSSTTKTGSCPAAKSLCSAKNSVPTAGKLSRKAARLKQEPKSPIIDSRKCTAEKKASGIKRKLVFTEYDVREALTNLKRQKVEAPSYSMVPYWMQVKQCFQQRTCAVPYYPITSNIIEGAIEEGEWFDAMHKAQISISTHHYPPPRLLNIFMQEMLVTSSKSLPNVICHLLKTCLCVHPPSDFSSLPNMYLESFCTEGVAKKNWDSSKLYVCCDTPWDFISHVIGRALGEATTGVAERGQSLLLLQYVVALFDQDFRAYCDRWKNKEIKRQGFEKSMVAKLLWPRGPVKPTALHMRRLMCYLVRAVIKAGGSDVHDEDLQGNGLHRGDLQGSDLHATDDGSLLECLRLLQALFGMAAECCRIAQAVEPEALSSGLSSEGSASDLIREMVSRLKQSDVLTKRLCIELYLDTLTLPWVKTVSLTAILSYYDNALVANSKMKTEKLSLAKIVKWYFYLLPKMSSTTIKSPRKETPTKISPSMPRIKSEKFVKINKRNSKGETSLQVACIRGHIARVKELLVEPGIDVNSQDNAGWTALHEACSNGHVACVRELLRYRSTKTIMHYFDNSKPTGYNGLNLLAAPPCGTTPLHDAVANGRAEIALLLLQHPHGGKKLLAATNKDGYTPLDYAVDMKKTLLAFDKENNNVVEAPRTSFEELESSIPDDETYRAVLGQPAAHVDSTKCATLAILIQQLLTTYITSNDLQNVKREVDFAHSRLRCNDDTVRPLASNINGRTSRTGSGANGAEKQPEATGYFGQLNEQRVLDDLEVFSTIGEHVSNFDKHLMRISNDSSVSLSMLLGLKWLVASQAIGEGSRL